jgi:hypothetical protein
MRRLRSSSEGGRRNVGPTKWAVCDRRALRARVSHTSRRRWPPPGVRLRRRDVRHTWTLSDGRVAPTTQFAPLPAK